MAHESLIRLGFFLGLLTLFSLTEALFPRRDRTQPRSRRWTANLGLVVLDTLTVQVMGRVLPFLAVGAAFDARIMGVGLFNLTDWPVWLEFLLAVSLLDFSIWLQHLLTHKIPLFWRFHRVHHADRDMDVTTALRFHPVEIAFSMLLKIAWVYVLGPSAIAVIVFEILLNGTAMFNHASFRLPTTLDKVIRWVMVTPDMHRVHHSTLRAEHDSNYGFALSVWDRLFQTYVAQPKGGHQAMTIGLGWQDDRPARIGWVLALPFFKK